MISFQCFRRTALINGRRDAGGWRRPCPSRCWVIRLVVLLVLATGGSRATETGPALPKNRKADAYESREEFLQHAAAFETMKLARMPRRHNAEEAFFAEERQAVRLAEGLVLHFRHITAASYAEGITPQLKEQVLAVPNRRGDLRRWEAMFDPERHDRVTIPYDFFMSETMVSNSMFAVFVCETGYETTVSRYGTGWIVTPEAQWLQGFANDWRQQVHPLSAPDHPVVQVSWFDAMNFAAWLSQKAGVIFRVPTKEEWLLAARPPGRREETYLLFPWGNSFNQLDRRMNFGTAELDAYSWIHDQYADGYAYSSPIRAFPPNDRGLHDMLGNVWVWNWTSSSAYEKRTAGERRSIPVALDELGAARNGALTMTGGCYLARVSHANLLARMSHPALDGAEDIGFRLVAVRRTESGF